MYLPIIIKELTKSLKIDIKSQDIAQTRKTVKSFYLQFLFPEPNSTNQISKNHFSLTESLELPAGIKMLLEHLNQYSNNFLFPVRILGLHLLEFETKVLQTYL